MNRRDETVDLIARIEAKPGAAGEVRNVLTAYATHVRAHDGTLRFEVYNDSTDADTFVVIERYLNRSAFEEHLADPENAKINASLEELTRGGSSLQFLTGAEPT